MAYTWRVDSFHLGLGVVGDSSIHLLVQGQGDGKPGKVSFALLVDGGDSGGDVRLVNTIHQIQALTTKYDLAPIGGTLKFNAVVISHWDSDHWTGVLTAMRKDIQSQQKKPPVPVTDFEVSFFRYQAGTPRKPETIVYCPAYGVPTAKGARLRPIPTTAQLSDTNLTLGAGTSDLALVRNVCKIRAEPANTPTATQQTIIGTNILTGKSLLVGTYHTIKSPAELVTSNPPTLNQPGIYILGASKRSIGSLTIVGAPAVVDETGGTPKNKSSVACMIIWNAVFGSAPRLSQYFAGDMHWEQEEQIAAWSGATGVRDQTGSWVPTMKASHHGAKSSTPITLLNKFNPRNVIASVGERNGHPSWELLFYLEGWMYDKGPEKAAYRPLLSTQFPYYLIRQRDLAGDESWLPLPSNKTHQMSMKVLEGEGGVNKKYLLDLATVWTTAGAAYAANSGLPYTNPALEWTMAKANDPTLDPKNWARTRIASAWPRLSAVEATAHPATGTARLSSANHQFLKDVDNLAYYLIESHNDSNKDGSAWVKYDSSPMLKQLWPDPDAVPPTQPGPEALAIPAYKQKIGSLKRVQIYPEVPDEGFKKNKLTYPASVVQSSPGYNPSPGTNPNENDAMSLEEKKKPLIRAQADGTPIIDPLPDPGLPAPELGAAPELQSPFYYICSSTVEFDEAPGPQVKQLQITDPLNRFLASLHMQGILFADIPRPPEAMFLHHQDEFQAWIIVALGVGGHGDPRVMATTSSVSGNITKFNMNIPALGSTFSSDGAVVALNVESGWGPAGTVPGQNCLIVGLETATRNTGLSLIDILAPASSRGGKLASVQLLQVALGDKLRFNLDTSIGSRNAIWFEPMFGYTTVVRSQYVADKPSLENMNSWISTFLNGFTIESLTAITKLTSKWVATREAPGALNSWEFILTTTCRLEGVNVVPMVTFDFAGALLTITLQFNYFEIDHANLLVQIMNWIQNQPPMKNAKFNFREWFAGAGSSNFSMPLFRRLILTVDLNPTTGLPSGSSQDLSIDLEVGVKFGRPGQQRVIFLFTYEWSQARGSVLRGSLWCPPPPPGGDGVDRRLLSDYEPYQEFIPSSIRDISDWAPALDLTNLIPSDPNGGGSGGKIVNIPDGVPTNVIMAVLELDGTAISFRGALECQEPKSKEIPPLFLSRLRLSATYTFASRAFRLDLGFAAAMYPQIGSTIPPIELRGLVNYETNVGFRAEAEVECPGMQGAHFLDYFDSKSAPAATALIQHIQLLNLHLAYEYQNGSAGTNPAKSFYFSGAIAIGKLELDLAFNYTGENTWRFSAKAGAHGEPSTIQEILDSIVGDGTLDLPSCVGDILVGVPAPATQSKEPSEFFDLTLTRLSTNGGGQDVIFKVSVNVGRVSFTFLQFRNTAWNVNQSPSKRFLRLEVTSLPAVEIPIIGNLTQPFDKMYFMWVQDGTKPVNPTSPPGLTKAEVATLNEKVLKDDPIYYKLSKDLNAYKDGDILVQAGCHFVLVLKDKQGASKVVLDYVFAKPKSGSTVPPPAEALKAHAMYQEEFGANAVIHSKPSEVDGEVVSAPPADGGGGTVKADMDKSVGPFSISNIGLKFTNSKLSICLDAKVLIGPIGMAMLGFSIDLDFSNGRNLQNNFPKPPKDISISLRGLAASFNRPPLTLAGGLLKQDLNGSTYYSGGVDIAFRPWAFLAAGGYGELKDPVTGGRFNSAFVFAKLNGPLITLEFATISGVTGGFGYNNSLTLPTIAQVPSFPFLKMPTVEPVTGDPTLDILMSLINSKWFKPQNNSFWVGAGLTVSAFEMLAITAVAVVEWDPEVKLGLFAVAVADIPSTLSTFKFAHVELGILAMVDFGKGLAKFEAQLAPSSFILDPSCHLTGGFALYYWFKDGPQQVKGDWVFSLGGYHPQFKPPSQYPIPPRLKIAWSLGPLSITGQSYFAITPNVAMAGGQLDASLVIGVLRAFFNAYMDFIINFKPFLFRASGGISVGVRYTLDLWFVTIHINIEIGATLVMQGPPIFGTARVNFWVFAFDVNFGSSQRPSAKPVSLPEFYGLVLQKGSPSASKAPPRPQLFMCKSGLLPSSPAADPSLRSTSLMRIRKDDEEVWDVAAGTFTFAINAVFALSKMTVYPMSKSPVILNAPVVPANPNKSQTVPIYSRPMHLTSEPMTSELRVSMTIETGSSHDYEPQWLLSPVIGGAPKALWDKYNQSADPTNGSKSLLGDPGAPTLPQMMGVTFVPPIPTLSKDRIQAFDAVASQKQNVLYPAPPFANSTTAEDPAWIPVEPVPPPPNDPAKPWQDVQDAWQNPRLGEGAAGEWLRAMGWDEGSVVGKAPPRLVTGLQRLYVAAPMMAPMIAV